MIIEVKNLSKRYFITNQRRRYLTIRDQISNIIHSPLKLFRKQKKQEFWALQDVSFEVEKGDVVGIVGLNGAGKSTLLKIISGIVSPTNGEVKLKGKVVSLLEVGTGFHPELTGRENIFFNGSILGMSKKSIVEKFDEIVEFSGVEKFLDTPVKHYSSGMHVKLAFSVAAHIDSDILLVDEVLAVGDVEFQKKCLGKMNEITKEKGKTILFVSHDMGAVQDLCKTCILLKDGKVDIYSDVSTVVNKYLKDKVSTESSVNDISKKSRKGAGEVTVSKISFKEKGIIESGDKVSLLIDYRSDKGKDLKNCRLGIKIKSALGQFLFSCTTEVHEKELSTLPSSGKIECLIDNLPLSDGTYYMDIFFEAEGVIQDWIIDVMYFEVAGGNFFDGEKQCPIGYHGRGVLVNHDWKILE